MPQIVPIEIHNYAAAHTKPLPPLLEELIRETESKFADRAQMLSGQVEGQFLRMLVAATGAQRVLEIGTFTGFSALMMASGLPSDGELVTLELSAEHAQFARSYIARSEDGGKIRLIEGPALESLKTLRGPFDFAFIDADKTSYPAYTEWAAEHLRVGGVVILDNALLFGEICDQPRGDRAPSILGMRRAHEILARSGRFRATMLPTGEGLAVGVKVK